MKSLTDQLRQLKKDIYIRLIIIEIIASRMNGNTSIGIYNLINSLKLSRSWIGKAISYIHGKNDKYTALREEVTDRAEPDMAGPEGEIKELLLDLQEDIADLTADLNAAYKNPGIADISDEALMCLEYAWQHLNQADFHLAYILDYEITMEQSATAEQSQSV